EARTTVSCFRQRRARIEVSDIAVCAPGDGPRVFASHGASVSYARRAVRARPRALAAPRDLHPSATLSRSVRPGAREGMRRAEGAAVNRRTVRLHLQRCVLASLLLLQVPGCGTDTAGAGAAASAPGSGPDGGMAVTDGAASRDGRSAGADGSGSAGDGGAA